MRWDKRVSKRKTVKVVVHCVQNGNSFFPEHFVSFTFDLSLQGARLVLPRETKIGNCITMAMEVPVYFFPLLVYGKVVWIKKTEGLKGQISNFIEAGIKFVNVETSDFAKLEDFLDLRNGYTDKCNRLLPI